MKKLILLTSLTLFAATTFGQFNWVIDFDSPMNLDRIVRDTISNPNCSWQVGQPNKAVFNSALSVPNAIMTNLFNPVSANDTSIFYLKHARLKLAPYHVFVLHFSYMLDGDSTDFGTIEISPDTGHTWINVLTQDTTFQMHWNISKPTLTGSTSGWQSTLLSMYEWASGFGTFPIYMTADTILFRFTYITDSGSTSHDGWMMDNFMVEDWFEGIQEIQNDNLISISPNPTSNELRIHRTKAVESQRIQIFNYTGQLFYDNSNFIGDIFDTRQLANGIYLMKYSDSNNFAIKKFVVQH